MIYILLFEKKERNPFVLRIQTTNNKTTATPYCAILFYYVKQQQSLIYMLLFEKKERNPFVLRIQTTNNKTTAIRALPKKNH